MSLASVPRDANGNLLPETPAVPLEAPNALLTMLLEHGVEILAAAAFLLILFHSLRRGTRPIVLAPAVAENESSEAPDEEVDLDLLARKRIEELLREEPERVGALLSHWAMSDDLYAEAP